jgi:hypothetical protein
MLQSRLRRPELRILFDQGVPVPLRAHLPSHQIVTAYERGWSQLRNGDLLVQAQAAGFEVFVTTDTNLRYQQDLRGRLLAIVVLSTTSWPRIRPNAGLIAEALNDCSPGCYLEIAIP